MTDDRDLAGSANKSPYCAISHDVLQIKRSDLDLMLDAALARRVGADRHDRHDQGRTDHPAGQESADQDLRAGIDHGIDPGPGEISEKHQNRVTLDDATQNLTDSQYINPPDFTDRATNPPITSSLADELQVRSSTPRRPSTPRRLKNKDYRSREHLTPEEMAELISAASPGRDRTLITTGYIHGLRLGELINLTWDQIDLNNRLMHVTRLKGGTSATHPIPAVELELLLDLAGESAGRYVFTSRQSERISGTTVRRIIRLAGNKLDLVYKVHQVHPHMLRHSCGYKLAADGVDTRAIQAYLGHRSIQCTVRYTEIAPGRFEGLWE